MCLCGASAFSAPRHVACYHPEYLRAPDSRETVPGLLRTATHEPDTHSSDMADDNEEGCVPVVWLDQRSARQSCPTRRPSLLAVAPAPRLEDRAAGLAPRAVRRVASGLDLTPGAVVVCSCV